MNYARVALKATEQLTRSNVIITRNLSPRRYALLALLLLKRADFIISPPRRQV